MSFFHYVFIWYVIGMVGIMISSFVCTDEHGEEFSYDENHLIADVISSSLGPIAFVLSIYFVYRNACDK
jgi:hypothetical protein